jgi:hypothetical protein
MCVLFGLSSYLTPLSSTAGNLSIKLFLFAYRVSGRFLRKTYKKNQYKRTGFFYAATIGLIVALTESSEA